MRPRGSALILVLLLLTVLVVLTAEIGLRSSTDARAVENRMTELQAQYALQGALVHAWGVLQKDLRADQTATSDLGLPMADWGTEDWGTPVSDLELGDGTYGFAISDELSRHPVNALLDGAGAQDPAQLLRLNRLLAASCPGLDWAPFAQALGDWMDADAIGTYEAGFDPPLLVNPRNLPLITAKECFLVPTATTELLLGADGLGGLLPKISTWTPGQINVNTASREVLYALSPVFNDSVFAQLQALRPLRLLDDLKPLLGIPAIDPLPPELSVLAVRSDTFRVALSFTKGSDTRRATAILQRGAPQPVRIWWDPDPLCP